MKIIIAGATGFIGRPLTRRLLDAGHIVTALSRHPPRGGLEGAGCLRWDGVSVDATARAAIAEADGVVNLSGTGVADRRWNEAFKQEITQSRVQSTRALAEAMASVRRPGSVYVTMSGINYYGDTGDAEIDESAPAGQDFMARLCVEWEHAARPAIDAGLRVVHLRAGPVLGRGGGNLAKMLPAFKLFVGGPIGSGRQWMSWIHLDDVVGLVEFALGNPSVRGAMNACAPSPVTMREFARALGKAVHRPAVFRVPGFAVKLLVGELAEVILGGQRALPRAAERWGYRFQYPKLEEALAAVFA